MSVRYQKSPFWLGNMPAAVGVPTLEQFLKPFDELWSEINPHRKDDKVVLEKRFPRFLGFPGI